MGLGVSMLLVAAGAVLAWAVHPTGNNPVDVNTVGYILLAVGAVGFLLSLLFWESWAGPGYWSRRRVVATDGYAAPRAGYGRRRTRVIEERDPDVY